MFHSLTRSMASLVMLPVFLPFLVSAIPAPDPLITPLASLEKRANGANIIGYSLSGTSWHTRSCNNGFFSTIGDVGNCCEDSSCDFITACIDDFIYYDSGVSSDCGNVCGTGFIFQTAGDLFPLSMYNCQSDWTATETITSDSTTTSPSVVTTTAQGSTVTVPNTANNVQSVASTTGAATTADTGATGSNRVVTLTVMNPDGSEATSISVVAAASSSTSTANADTSSSAGNKGSSNETSHSNVGAIAGGVVGGIAVLAIIAGVIVFFLVKRNKKNPATIASGTGTGGVAAPGPHDQPHQNPYPPPMQENGAWQQNNGYGYGQAPQVYPSQDYKMPMAGGGYANAPPAPQGPHTLSSTPAPAPTGYGPQEMYSGPVHAPTELPVQVYGR